MNDTLLAALEDLIRVPKECPSAGDAQRQAIFVDLLWKLVRKDYHGVCDCSNDLRELHL